MICKRLLCLMLLLLPLPAHAESSAQQQIIKASLVSERTAITPGQKLRVGILLEPIEDWHTYWENPGDAGIPTSLTWTLPPDFSASDVDWPVPQRITEGPLVIFGYVGKVFLPVTLTMPEHLGASDYSVKVKASWLVCKDICIPESATLDLTLPVGDSSESPAHALFAAHDAIRPTPVSTALHYDIVDKNLLLTFPLNALGNAQPVSATFFPRQENIIQYAPAQKLDIKDSNVQLSMERAGGTPKELSGLLEVESAEGKIFYDVSSSPTAATAAPFVPVSSTMPATSVSLPGIIFAAILGGLILNLMPCVLPVLSLKSLSIVKKAGSNPEAARKQGIAYTLGILISFGVFAAVLIALQKAGQSVGWGFQMQSPPFVGFLIYLLFLVGLSLSGVFHLPVLLGGVSVNDDSAKGSFFTGVLATAVATPCTAPFMASAVGVALSLHVWQAMLVFEALGFGLALPFLAVSFFPAALKFLPKPGAWMESFKQFLAFPMYASVIWLLWVLTLQTGAGGMAVALCGMLVIIVGIWMKPLFSDGSYRIATVVVFIGVMGVTLPMLSKMELSAMPMPTNTQGAVEIPFSKDKLAELRAAGKPVFIDATAAWCLTCQINGRTVIHTDRVMQAFKDNDVTLMIADWTRQNPEITELLAGFGFQGVPLYVFYPAKGDPAILPQLLTQDIVINTIKGEP